MAQWSKDGQLINDSRVITAPNSTTLTLTNNDATIRGRYLVNVSNIGGSDTFQYNVKAECKSHVEYILRTVKAALNLLFIMRKYARILQ